MIVCTTAFQASTPAITSTRTYFTNISKCFNNLPHFCRNHQKRARKCCLLRAQGNVNNKNDNNMVMLQDSQAVLPTRLQKLCDSLHEEPDEKGRLLKLARLGDDMDMLDESELKPSTRVSGCTSVTHLKVKCNNAVDSSHTKTDNDSMIVHLEGFSDAKFARGLLALVVLGLDGENVGTIRKITAGSILLAAGIEKTMTKTSIRHNGMNSIMKSLHITLSNVEDNDELKTSDMDNLLCGRWSDVQGSNEVAVLLSGGVDSSVALRLALETGKKVRAFYLKIWLDDESAHLGTSCPWEEDMNYARSVCSQVGVPLYDIPLQQAYWDDVVSYTVSEAKKGRTPNPDVMCNTRVKFGAFFKTVMDHERYEHVITGHYARKRVCDITNKAQLYLSRDEHKDQTYFLSHLTQSQVSRAEFPLGNYTKSTVRQMADEFDLPNKNRPDSQGICFLGKLKFDDFLRLHVGEEEGDLVNFDNGERVGIHKGFWFFTVGQRKGIGLSDGPWYVVAKNVKKNIVYVSRTYHAEDKQRREFSFDSTVWIANEWPKGLNEIGNSIHLRVKTRHGPTLHDAIVKRCGFDQGHVTLAQRDKGLAVGQFCAFYKEDGECLGSGVICDEPSLLNAPVEILEMRPESKRLQAHTPVCKSRSKIETSIGRMFAL